MHHSIDLLILDALNKDAPEDHRAERLVYGTESTVTAVTCCYCRDSHPLGPDRKVRWDRKYFTHQELVQEALNERRNWDGTMGVL